MKTSSSLKASLTIEMAYIMPLVGLVFFISIIGIFYYHDKNIIHACAYETAVSGSVKAREKEGVQPSLLEGLFRERVRGKCIFFQAVRVEVSVTEDEIQVRASASKGRLSVLAEKTAAITKPELFIRKVERIK